MGFHLSAEQFDLWIAEQKKTHDIYAPKRFVGGNTFSDVDCIRYGTHDGDCRHAEVKKMISM